MRIALFCHSLLSDWNHGNAHFLRGIASELARRGHVVRAFEPNDAWSAVNLVAEHGEDALAVSTSAYPLLSPRRYDRSSLVLDDALDGVDVVLVHEWNDPELVRRIGDHKKNGAPYKLLFHDTHHRAATAPDEMARFDLSGYDGVLAFGSVLRDIYLARGWAARAWVWHHAADVRVFSPRERVPKQGDLVWFGNWGDDERTDELTEFLLRPSATIGLVANVFGVRYPEHAKSALRSYGVAYRGWLPNFRVPELFASHRVTVHVPRKPYAAALPGIPTIRTFEAMACGIPLVSAPWRDTDGLFDAGRDYLVARDGAEMQTHLARLLHDEAERRELAAHALRTIHARHTCAHRVDELLAIARDLGARTEVGGRTAQERSSHGVEAKP
jgi:spore maturation protein CgeB